MTAKTDLELEIDELLVQEDEDAYKPRYFYDIEENYWQLRKERGDMPSPIHNRLVEYLKAVLIWYYRAKKYFIDRELNFYDTDNFKETPLIPDIFVIKSRQQLLKNSYRVGVDGPPPEVVIEVVSDNHPLNDLKKKPQYYEEWKIEEYFVYDPRTLKRKTKKSRLTGWRLVDGKYQKLMPDEQGRIWSEQLDSWLVPDGELMHLYDKEGNLRLTRADYLAEKLRQLGEDPDTL